MDVIYFIGLALNRKQFRIDGKITYQKKRLSTFVDEFVFTKTIDDRKIYYRGKINLSCSHMHGSWGYNEKDEQGFFMAVQYQDSNVLFKIKND